jgi:acyl carrier protein
MANDAGRHTGVGSLDPELAISIFSRAVVAAEPTVVVGNLQQPQLLAALFSVRPSSLLGDLPEARRVADAAVAQRQQIESAGSQIRERLGALSEVKQVGFLVDLVRTQAAGVLGHSGTEVMGADKAFRELGVDSLSAIEIRNQLAGATGLTLPTGLVFDYPTPRVLASHLLGELLGEPEEFVEAEFRAVLGSLSLAQLRQAGLLEALLQLTRRITTEASTAGGDPGESIDTMDAEDLAKAVLKGHFDLSLDDRGEA